MSYMEEDPPCDYCRVIDRLVSSYETTVIKPEQTPDGLVVSVYDGDTLIARFDELALSCLCGRRVT